jgi:cytochrome c oxidase cbb3-type subunit 3
MANDTRGQLLDHEYDGIREYDNPCPAWWHMIFIGTFLFGVVYFVFFQLGNMGWTVDEAYQDAMAANVRLRYQEIGDLTADEPTLMKYMNEPDWLQVGANVYAANCRSCHADNGSGFVGPNLTDDYYKNVKNLVDVARVVSEGAGNGAMPAWRTRLHPNDVVLVSAYVAKMRGENLAGKKPEGELIDPWPTAPAEPDSATSPPEDANPEAK